MGRSKKMGNLPGQLQANTKLSSHSWKITQKCQRIEVVRLHET